MSTAISTQYRVETRDKVNDGRWIPDGGRIFAKREEAEAYLQERAAWYDNPDRFEQRISARAVSDWSPLVPTVEFPR